MAPKSNSPQGSLLEMDPDTYAERPVDLDSREAAFERFAVPATPGTPPTPDTSATVNKQLGLETKTRELEQQTAYHGLLKTFGEMNKAENFQARFEDSPLVVEARFKPRYGDGTNTVYEESVAANTSREQKAKAKVGKMLGLKAMVESGAVTKDQAKAIQDATYGHYERTFKGIDKKNARKSQQGKASRRIKRLEKELNA
jgi:hypothetical protein